MGRLRRRFDLMRDLKSNKGVDFAMFEMKLNLRCPSIHWEHIINGCAHGNPPQWARQRAGLSFKWRVLQRQQSPWSVSTRQQALGRTFHPESRSSPRTPCIDTLEGDLFPSS